MHKFRMGHVAAIMLAAFSFDSAVAAAEPATFVFQNVRALTMTESGIIDGANVTVTGNRIVAVTAKAPEIPEGARVIDASGMTLMPGLADMHVHYFSATEGPMYVANGVTAVRNPWGSLQARMLDTQSKEGVVIGPHVYSSGPLMDGPEPIWGEGSMQLTSPEQAIGAVESQRTSGYRAVKLYEGLTPEIYRAAVTAAKDRDMQVWAHVPNGMTVEDVIALEVDSIEHFDDVNDSAFIGNGEEVSGYFALWSQADAGRLAALASQSAEAGVWHCPTFAVIARRYEYGADAEAFFASSISGYVGKGVTEWWRGSAARMGPYDEQKKQAAQRQALFLKLLHDAGAPLLIGTDTPNPFVVPGFAIHDELEAFVTAGIPIDDVLRIATSEAARFLREEGEWGVIAEGARADLLLLDVDPHDDLTTLRQPRGVMVNGHWYDADRLAAALASLRAKRDAEKQAEAEEQSAAE